MDKTLAPLPPYARMTRFTSPGAARVAYQAVQDFIFARVQVELSVFNLLVSQASHVVVLGEQPGTALNEQMTKLLAAGEPTQLPPKLLRQLAARRAQQHGPWSEHHPGLPGELLS